MKKSRMGLEMAHPERFELPTDRFVADYSIQLSYGCVTFITLRRVIIQKTFGLGYTLLHFFAPKSHILP